MIHRFSSLAQQLNGAKAYDRIAGYFCASILETAGDVPERTRVSVQPSAFSIQLQMAEGSARHESGRLRLPGLMADS